MTQKFIDWTWILALQFFIISIIEIKFALLGLIFMFIPIYFAFKGKRELYCSQYCPQGSMLRKMLAKISLNNNLPNFIETEEFRKIMLVFICCTFLLSMHFAGFTLIGIAYSVFKLILCCTAISIPMGIFYKPLAWCEICPFKYTADIISNKKAS